MKLCQFEACVLTIKLKPSQDFSTQWFRPRGNNYEFRCRNVWISQEFRVNCRWNSLNFGPKSSNFRKNFDEFRRTPMNFGYFFKIPVEFQGFCWISVSKFFLSYFPLVPSKSCAHGWILESLQCCTFSTTKAIWTLLWPIDMYWGNKNQGNAKNRFHFQHKPMINLSKINLKKKKIVLLVRPSITDKDFC